MKIYELFNNIVMKKLFKIILTVSFFLILTACEPPYEPCDGIQDTVKSQN